MTEYIERDKVVDLFDDGKWQGQICVDAVKEIPSANVAPVIHAHVVVNWLGDCHCSNCGESIDCTSNYCNWCGAILDELEQKEEP